MELVTINITKIEILFTCLYLVTVPLLHVLAMHGRLLAHWPAWHTWQQVAGDRPETNAIARLPNEVPLLLRDPTALLTQFILLLPLHLDQSKSATRFLKKNSNISVWHHIQTI